MKHANDVRNAALDILRQLKADKITVAQAKEMNNAIGKAIAISKLELQAFELRDEKPNIPFLSSRDYGIAEVKIRK